MDYKNYIEECNEMAIKKRNNDELQKVYSDLNFEQMAFQAQEYLDYLDYVSCLFDE
ncbi:hypothetical protein [uncultured Robinsoniella sp.]|uniref:hypothetical protein n=1 Tax=uncultured Robinsoniella sp. TaxID=904190 RepID=UPI00374EECC5